MGQTIDSPLHLAGAWDIYPPQSMKRTVRWMLKQLLFFVYLYCGWIFIRDNLQSLMGISRIIILYYHRVGWMDFISKPTRDFRLEMQYLAAHYQCLTLRQLAELVRSGSRTRRKIAVVTFDDGYRDNYLAAFPEMKRVGICGTFFVSTGYIGTERKFPHDSRAVDTGQAARDDWPKMNWDELRLMQQAGMEIGSHTVEHINLGQVDALTMRHELVASLQKLNEELGFRPRSFCFPWGRAGDFTPEAVKAVQESGYFAAVTTIRGKVARSDDLFQLRRIDVGNGHLSRLGALATIEGLGCGWLARLLRKLLA